MKTLKTLLAASVAAVGLAAAPTASAGSSDYLAEIMETAATFCPRGTYEMNGQILPISSNTALFSLLGTTYGGDGRTTFGLPDLRGRVSMHPGTGPGLSPRVWGRKGGAQEFTMTVNQMPTHSHQAGMRTVAAAPDTNSPAGASLTVLPNNAFNKSATPGPAGAGARFMNPATILMTDTGGGQAVVHESPYLVTRKCMTVFGTYPSRN